MTSKAIEQVKHSKNRDACALSVIRLGLSSIIDLFSEFPEGMKFEDPLTTDIKKIMEMPTTSTQMEDMVCKRTRRKIDLRIICREKDIELSHSECARMITRIKITKDRSKSLRINKRVLDKYLINNLSEKAVKDFVIIGLQFADNIDLFDEGLYFSFEGLTFAFSNQLCNLSSLQETLEALYFLK
ncbi:8631_t:CDS:2, partial [Funneliformis mosseae]